MSEQDSTVNTAETPQPQGKVHTDTSRHQHRTRHGKVVAISGEQTISVQIENLVKHPIYGKYVGRRRKLAVHDAKNEAKVGDVVEISPCRRLSKRKAHRLVRIVREAVIERA